MVAAIHRRQPHIIVPSNHPIPRLVAVSKLKPTASIIEAYECGQRHFGENYIQELLEKSKCSELIEKCPDIKFHFIGHLQSNKVNKLLNIRNLYVIETVDSIKLANQIDKVFGKQQTSSDPAIDHSEEDIVKHDQPMKVMIQVNTSGEQQKSGIDPDEAPNLAEHIKRQCKNIELFGLMTIGKLDGWDGLENQDFVRLYQTRDRVAERISIRPEELELSMGMSDDFEEAITLGSTNIRIGSLIFGHR